MAPIRIELPVPRMSPDLRALLRVTRPPPHPVSDALIEVARRFTKYPPAAGGIDEFAQDVALVAAVWNATIAESSVKRAHELDAVAHAWQGEEGFEATHTHVLLIAARKLELYADDLRLIAGLQIQERDGETLVEVAHVHLTPPRADPAARPWLDRRRTSQEEPGPTRAARLLAVQRGRRCAGFGPAWSRTCSETSQEAIVCAALLVAAAVQCPS